MTKSKNNMNREIKFRVWDNVDYMSKPLTLQEVQSGKIQFTSDCAVMQFTGLKDKNGKEIYEGDVVKWETTYLDLDAPDGMERKPITKMGKVAWIGKSFWIDSKDHPESFGYEGEDLWNWSEIEIIGNIYENPELLK